MSEADPFGPSKLTAMREEIRRDGLLADKFLASDPDMPTFGLNLACAWPFPEAWRESYERMAAQLSQLGPWVYVYPFPTTHVTLLTLVNFARHIRPSTDTVTELQRKLPTIVSRLSLLFDEHSSERIKPLTLKPQALVLARGAGILPLLNPGGAVQRLRQRALELLQRDAPLHRELLERGLNIPGIIHSTVMRFREPPPSLEQFLAAFEEIAGATKFPPLEVREILLTTETKPYMREGKVLHRFALGGGGSN